MNENVSNQKHDVVNLGKRVGRTTYSVLLTPWVSMVEVISAMSTLSRCGMQVQFPSIF